MASKGLSSQPGALATVHKEAFTGNVIGYASWGYTSELTTTRQKEDPLLSHFKNTIKETIEPVKYVPCQVNGLIDLPQWMFDTIIDTPEFQRMRRIKQLGTCQYAYPACQSTRFEHSLGVGYLGSRYWKTLVRNSELELEKHEKKRIEEWITIAGLCHDLGHGPMSHGFEALMNGSKRETERLYRHEIISQRLLERIGSSNDRLTEEDIVNVQDLILGKMCKGTIRCSPAYSIVANEAYGIDVDRLDYLQRDTASLGINEGQDVNMQQLLLQGDRVCFSMSELGNIAQLFSSRFRLFYNVYFHHKSRSIEYMLYDVFHYLDNALHITAQVDDLDYFISLDDSLFTPLYIRYAKTLLSQDDNSDVFESLDKASHLLDRIDRHDIYTLAGETLIQGDSQLMERVRQNFTQEKLLAFYIDDPIDKQLVASDIVLDWTRCHFGTGNRNPLEAIQYYGTSMSQHGIATSHKTDEYYCMHTVRVFSRRTLSKKKLTQCFNAWIKTYVPKESHVENPYLFSTKVVRESYRLLSTLK